MAADALSQAEIDALLSGFAAAGDEERGGAGISADEREALDQYQQAFAQAIAEVLSGLLNTSAKVVADGLQESTPESAAQLIRPPCVSAEWRYAGGLAGLSVLLFAAENAYGIVSALMGGADIASLNELEESAFAEVVSQVQGAAHTKLGAALRLEIQAQPPRLGRAADGAALRALAETMGGRFVTLIYRLTAGAVSGAVHQFVPNELIGALLTARAAQSAAASAKESPRGPEIARVEFAELEPTPGVPAKSLDLILDIGLVLKVELGRTRRQVRDILSLTQGTVIELNKLVGEPLDIIVNDQLFARGEVVVVDENFGVRVTEILSQQERIEALKAKGG